MSCVGKSLRQLVEQWLAPVSSEGLRVIEMRNRRSTHERYVRIEAMRATGPISLAFFRHADGRWSIFPPNRETPTMQCYPLAE
ncbi:hypothetical protein BZM26_00685 [Paraburkholderia strydomiana]|nr:hypothetical protein BZM26_00685 [Paraburkholderia strydomiana]